MTELEKMGKSAVAASRETARLNIMDKNNALIAIADAIVNNAETILKANEIDMENGRNQGMKQGLLDRLQLTNDRIIQMADRIMVIEDGKIKAIGKKDEIYPSLMGSSAKHSCIEM